MKIDFFRPFSTLIDFDKQNKVCYTNSIIQVGGGAVFIISYLPIAEGSNILSILLQLSRCILGIQPDNGKPQEITKGRSLLAALYFF